MRRAAEVLSATLLCLLLVQACGRAGFGETEASGPAGLVISRVIVDAERLQPGQQLVEIRLHLRNRTTTALGAVSASLRFERDGADLAEYFEVEEAADNASALLRAEGLTLVYWVNVWADLDAGAVQVDASASARRPDGLELRAEAALEPAEVEVVVPEAVVVTTAADEDDTGGAPSVGSAGGLNDISLREALLIAEAAATPQVIRFDPSLFAPTAPVVIVLDPGLGLLPAITGPLTSIDGSDAGVIIDGSAVDSGSGLLIAADDVTLRGIAMRGFNGGEPYYCVESQGVDRVQIESSVFEDCGTDEGGGAQVTLRGGQGHRVIGNLISGGRRDGLHLADLPTGCQVLRNQFLGNNDDGIEITGTGHLIADNVVQGNGGNGAENNEMVNVTFRDNSFADNGGAGFMIHGGSSGVRFELCDFSGNESHGLEVLAGNIGVEVRGGSFGGNGGDPIWIGAGANESVQPPVVTSFDSSSVSGTAAVTSGEVEVWSFSETMSSLGRTAVSNGAWSLSLDPPQPAVLLTLTTSNGSTSAFSELILDGPTDLVVTTADDELDGGEGIVTINQAGGAADLSLREAIVLANAWRGPDTITFSPTVFPPASETSIALSPAVGALGPLPVVNGRGTIIDGAGSGVVIDGGGLPFDRYRGAIGIEANDCAVRNLKIRNFNAQDGACIVANHADYMQVSGVELSSCGGLDTGSGVRLINSDGSLVTGSTIRNSFHAVYGYNADDNVVEQNDLSSRGGNCVFFNYESSANTVADNWMHGCGSNGVRLSDNSDFVVMIGNRIYGCGGSGFFMGTTHGSSILFNTVVGCELGLQVHASTSDLLVRNNIFTASQSLGMLADVEAGWDEGSNLLHNNANDGSSGASALAVGVDGGVSEPAPVAPSDIFDDPVLSDPANGDMTPGPAAVDQGVDLGYDRNGTAPGLFNGVAPDIGAVETP